MMDVSEAFKDDRTIYLVNDKVLSKTILFNPDPDDLARELKHSRRVTAQDWDAFETKSQRDARLRKQEPSQ